MGQWIALHTKSLLIFLFEAELSRHRLVGSHVRTVRHPSANYEVGLNHLLNGVEGTWYGDACLQPQLVSQRFKRKGLVDGQISHNLAVKVDVGPFECVGELSVPETVIANGG